MGIILCGGSIDGEGATSECQIFEKESSSWKMTKMSRRRYGPASAPLSGALWVTGGFDENDNGLSTSELIYPNGQVIPGPSLPSEMAYHCMVTLDNQNIMIISQYGAVGVYNPVNETFSGGPSTFWSFGGRAACALFRS